MTPGVATPLVTSVQLYFRVTAGFCLRQEDRVGRSINRHRG
jgi:hypothetical protein